MVTRCLGLAACLAMAAPWRGATGQDTAGVGAALASGDTAQALTLFRRAVRKGNDPALQCAFASLLTRSATRRTEDWKARAEAKAWFDRALRLRPDPMCLLAYAGLMERQGIRVDATRLTERAMDLIARDSTLWTPALGAELLYHRAVGLAGWVREFDHLVLFADLPVSTPDCLTLGPFCESVVRPASFRERLRRAAEGASLVDGRRLQLQVLLDSALALAPAHPGVLQLAFRDAAMAGDWDRFADLAARARRADTATVGALLPVLAGAVMRGERERAGQVFDTIMDRLGPEAMARYEGLALIADTSIRERLRGSDQVVYGEAVWGLSDPLYLTARNERRVEHYARITLAEVVFSDPIAGVVGRDSPQGRLVIRYGLPLERYAVKADRRQVLTEAQRAEVERLACQNERDPTTRRDRPADVGTCVGTAGAGLAADGGGRWEFWYYAPDGPPFIFERALGGSVARHLFDTQSARLDSLLHRAVPSSYDPPFHGGGAAMLVTAFPRPDTPAVEVWARFRSDQPSPRGTFTDVGIFAHDRGTGRMLGYRVTRRAARPELLFEAALPLTWGRYRIAAEGASLATSAAAQVRAEVDLPPPERNALSLSGLLLGDSALAPAVPVRRADVTVSARADSVYAPGAPLALYWEIYGIRRGDAEYRVRLTLTDAADRPLLASAVRSVGHLLGSGDPLAASVEWDVRRRVDGVVVPEVVNLTLPDAAGLVRITIEVTDRRTRRVATSARVIQVAAGPPRDAGSAPPR